MNLKAARFLVFTCALLLLSAVRAAACSCGGIPSPAEAFESATAVFVGTVVSATPEGEGEAVYGEQTVVLRAEEVFKGLQVGREVKLAQPGHNCAPKYKTGFRGIFYANYDPKTKTWEVYGCGRGSSLERAADDLLYLRALPLSAQRNRVSGALEHYEDGPERGFDFVGPLAGVKVKIKGKDKTYEATTDSNGVYEIYDLPAGTYTIEPELPFGLKVRFPMAFGPANEVYREDGHAVTSKVVLTEKTCAGSDFVVSSDNVVGGRVLGPGGVPLKMVCLDLLPAVDGPGPRGGGGRIFDCTNEEGRYKFEEVPPGRYRIAANSDGRLSGSEPFPSTFYPGTFERAKAEIITVGRGDSRNDYDVAIPSLLPTVTVSGVLVYTDGRPVEREGAAFFPDPSDKPYEQRIGDLTDEAGRFSLTVLRGVPGKLQADMYLYEGKFEKPCPAVTKLVKERGDNLGSVTIQTPSVAFDAERDRTDVRLVLPLPYCGPRRKVED